MAQDKNGQKSRGEQVFEDLRGAIAAGDYKPGERLRETEIAERLGVSRTPVREALRRLQASGIVVSEAWRGMIVAELDHRQIIELYAMRRVLEGAAAALAARHAAPSEVAQMTEHLDRFEASIDAAAPAPGIGPKTEPKTGPETLAAHNRQFHQAIYQAAHNRYLLQTLNTLRDSLSLLRSTTYALSGRAEAARAEHRAILDAIAGGNADAAEAAARHHIDQAEQARLRVLADLEASSSTPA